jgi:hypothetical protein
MEVCWVMKYWKEHGWDFDSIIDQSLKWHMSSFNAKSSAVPPEWRSQVNRWLGKMGYRFALRKLTYPELVRAGQKLSFNSWWENLGVAPCYRRFPVALRLKGEGKSEILITDADIRKWLPGDSLLDSSVLLPSDLAPGPYQLSIAIVDSESREPRVKLASEGRDEEGWYELGKISVTPSK